MLKKLLFVSVVMLGLVGCNSKQAKQGGEEAFNYIKKEYKALNENKAYKYIKYKNRYENAKEIIQNYSSYYFCNRCLGYGVLYLVDEYGNPIYDTYGNLIFNTCPNCKGSGYVSY